MRGEHVGQESLARGEAARATDPRCRGAPRRAVIDAGRAPARPSSFSSAARERHRIAGELRPGRVGQELPLPAHRHRQDPGDDRRDDQGEEPEHEHDEAERIAAALAVLLLRRRTAADPAAAPQHPAHAVRHQRDRAHHAGQQGHEPDVEVADVRHLVRHHALQLVPAQRLEQSLGDGDAGRLPRPARWRRRWGRRRARPRPWAWAARRRSPSPRRR